MAMSEHRSEKQVPSPWQVPVALEDIAEEGQHFDLAADQDVRAAIARVAGLRDLPRLEAKFDVTRRGATGLHVAGHVSATVGQNCVVTLEPLTNEVDEDVDLEFAPPRPVVRKAPDDEAAEETKKPSSAKVWNEPEPLVGGGIDLGALATEFLILGLDPYPRKPGAVFQPPQDLKGDEGPFAALANLTKGRDGN
jgi:Large ribosomal RNA subunit accumulation protein YceD